jgi:hypothetical protein
MFDNNSTKGLQLSYSSPAAWATPAVPVSFFKFADVEVQITGTITTPYTPYRSLDGVTFYPCNASDKDGGFLASITVPGIYSLPGSGWLYFPAGAGASLTVRASV